MRRHQIGIRNLSDMVRGILIVAIVTRTSTAAEPPSIATIMAFRPVQKDVVIETPSPAEFSKCRIAVERSGSTSGWIVTGPNGQILRRFLDSDGDGIVDQWSYFNLGLEVYRDLDTDGNKKVDQSRWLHTGGTRWGVDQNEDGVIERWKVLSAEEASREAIDAMVAGNTRRLQAVLINEAEIKSLGLPPAVSDRIMENLSRPDQRIRETLSSSRVLNARSRWARFDNSTLMPSIIPAAPGRIGKDLHVYSSAMAMVANGEQNALVQLGEMVRIGEVWKLTQIPQPIEGNSLTTTGLLMQPGMATSANSDTPKMEYSAKVKLLLEELQKLDENSPDAASGQSVITRYNRRRAELLDQLVQAAESEDERAEWTRQLVAGIAASVQTGGFPEGLKRLEQLDRQFQDATADSDLAGFVRYRLILAQYSMRGQTAASAEQREDLQDWWIGQLEDFVESYPRIDDAAEALLQLAIIREFSTRTADAEKLYAKIVEQHPEAVAAERARGALRRFGLENQVLALKGTDLQGQNLDIEQYRQKVVLVYFWATWCQPCTEELPRLRELHAQYREKGFEIVGINLDTTSAPIAGYLTQNQVTWPQIHEPGGLECRLAREFGIISLPTMFLINRDGKVENRNASLDGLASDLPELLDQ